MSFGPTKWRARPGLSTARIGVLLLCFAGAGVAVLLRALRAPVPGWVEASFPERSAGDVGSNRSPASMRRSFQARRSSQRSGMPRRPWRGRRAAPSPPPPYRRHRPSWRRGAPGSRNRRCGRPTRGRLPACARHSRSSESRSSVVRASYRQRPGRRPGLPRTVSARPDGLADDRPCVLEVLPRGPPVGDRGVPPFHVPTAHRAGETAHRQEVELLVGDETHHRGRAPALDRVEIGVEVARPRPRHAGGIGLARTQRDADATMALAGRDRSDPEWARFAGSWCRHPLKARQVRPRRNRGADTVRSRSCNPHSRCCRRRESSGCSQPAADRGPPVLRARARQRRDQAQDGRAQGPGRPSAAPRGAGAGRGAASRPCRSGRPPPKAAPRRGGGAWRGRIPGPAASSTQVSRASSARRRRYAEYAAISPRTGARQARYLARTSSSRSQS